MNVLDHLHTFCRQLSIAYCPEDTEFTFRVNSSYCIRLHEKPDGYLVLDSSLGLVDRDGTIDFLAYNAFHDNEHPYIFSRTKSEQEITLWRRVPKNVLNECTLRVIFEEFLDLLEAINDLSNRKGNIP